MELILALALVLAVVVFIVGIRPGDLPVPEPVSPVQHLEERKARIYEGLRDLQFEFRIGKLSEHDYQRTKLGLQQELAGVMAEIDHYAPAPAVAAAAAAPDPLVCPHCKARMDKPLKFCGECGKPMAATAGGAA